MKKLARLRVLAINSTDKPVTATLHDGGNLFAIRGERSPANHRQGKNGGRGTAKRQRR